MFADYEQCEEFTSADAESELAKSTDLEKAVGQITLPNYDTVSCTDNSLRTKESGMCDRRKTWAESDSCNYCKRGSRWAGWLGIGNHWCCTENDLSYGDCECTLKIFNYQTADAESTVAMSRAESLAVAKNSPGTNVSMFIRGLAIVGLGAVVYGAFSFYSGKH